MTTSKLMAHTWRVICVTSRSRSRSRSRSQNTHFSTIDMCIWIALHEVSCALGNSLQKRSFMQKSTVLWRGPDVEDIAVHLTTVKLYMFICVCKFTCVLVDCVYIPGMVTLWEDAQHTCVCYMFCCNRTHVCVHGCMLHVYVCMCVCTYVSMTWMHVRIYVYLYVYIYVYVYIYIYIYIYDLWAKLMYVCMYAYMYVCVCVYTPVHVLCACAMYVHMYMNIEVC